MKIKTVDDLIKQVSEDFPNFDPAKIRHAYDVAAEAHKHQKRKTGEPYVSHCLATAAALAELRMDPPVVMAGLLHDTVEDTSIELADLERDFGHEVARLVDGVTRLSQIAEATGGRKRNLGHIEAESLRKMFLAMSEDVRIVLIKLADRLHNMRTLYPMRPDQQIRIAHETREIFAPLAYRLGLWQIKSQLEDLCLRYMEPEVYFTLLEGLNEREEERDLFLKEVCESLSQTLTERGIEAEVSRTPKQLYKIYKKMQRKDGDLHQIFDVGGLRVIVNSKAECYYTLGIVHSLWRPIPQEFDDYIGNPKENNYQSLHTAVYGPGGKTLQVQVRTHQMHYYAEYGVAAHWLYREKIGKELFRDQQIRFLRQMTELRNEDGDEGDAESFMDKVRSDVLADSVFVFTPKGELRELPAGATSLDFAYYIHTEVGHHCQGAKINGKIVPLSYQLQYGDQVEILTDKSNHPKREWLNPYLGHVKTVRAKNKIRSWFRKQTREENIRQGREMMELELRQLGLKVSLSELAEKNHLDLDDFFAEIGAGDLSPHRIAVRELEARRAEESPVDSEAESALQEKVTPKSNDLSIIVRGVGDLKTRIARCCDPMQGEDIIGYMTRGHGVTVHQRRCPNILNKIDRERIIELDWGVPQKLFPVTLKILAQDRDGLLRDIVDIVANEKVNIASANAITHKTDHSAIITATLEVSDVGQLLRILSRINGLPDVVEAHREMS
ncbi:MAG: RelA/SpoT family protein [Ardenticatenaceae bacterium]